MDPEAKKVNRKEFLLMILIAGGAFPYRYPLEGTVTDTGNDSYP